VRYVSPARLQVHLRSDRPDEISFQVSPEQGPHRRCVIFVFIFYNVFF
jgi:hypothetical protein